jgi:hypothetical protein
LFLGAIAIEAPAVSAPDINAISNPVKALIGFALPDFVTPNIFFLFSF